LLKVFRFEFEFKFEELLKGFFKVNPVNQEWHLVKHVMLDSMMPLDDGVITKYSPINVATSFNLKFFRKP
jgi:hypothetical protein